MAIDKDLIEQILAQADIVDIISSYISVTKKGRNYVALCPFHDDKNPSMMISKEKQIFKCFVCGAGGNAFSFVERYEKISFVDAVKKVAALIAFDDPRLHDSQKVVESNSKLKPYLSALNDLTDYYSYSLTTTSGKDASDYLNARHLSSDIQKRFRLGYANTDGKSTIQYMNTHGHSYKTLETVGVASHLDSGYVDRNAGRVIFPICNPDGDVIGFSARRLNENKDEAKYVNSPESPLFHKANVIFNYHNARKTSRRDGYVYVLEGFMDVFALVRIGIESAVALMGTALTKEHISLLRGLGAEVRLCFDGDKPGRMATLKAMAMLESGGINYRIVSASGDLRDPDEILNQSGEEALKKYLNNFENGIDFTLNYYKETNPLSTVAERKKLIQDFIPILSKIKSKLELEDYIYKLSSISKFDARAIREIVTKARNESLKTEDISTAFATFHPERKHMKKLQRVERELLYQMLHDARAVKFYESSIESFYDEMYRNIANFIIEYEQNHEVIKVDEIISSLSESGIDNKEALINEITSISMEEFHAPCSDELLSECKNSLDEEKNKIYQKEMLQKSLSGKTDEEKARIAADYARLKAQKKMGGK